ncbi:MULTISPECIES: CHAT domain-containing protein [unclassified Nonomuraea]|uniref:CHAT domain-containing protein n=1 Tax=unclassified Nonomuraea TaxID=2593643 RepID=UPI0033DA982A
MNDDRAGQIIAWRRRREDARAEGWEDEWRTEMVAMLIGDPDVPDGADEAIHLLSEAPDPTWEEESALADLLLCRHGTGRAGPADLDQAVERLRSVLVRCGQDQPQQLLDLALALALRADARPPGIADRDEAIGWLERADALCGPEEPVRPVVLYWLAVSVVERAQDRTDLDRAVDHLEEALGLGSLDDPGRAEVEARLGDVLAYRIIHHGGDGPALDRAIGLLEAGYDTLEEAPARQKAARTIAGLYDRRAGRPCGPAPDRGVAAGWLRRALAEEAPQGVAQCHADLGLLLLRQCLPEDTPEDLTGLGLAAAAELGARARAQGAEGTLAEAGRHLGRAAEPTGDPRMRGLAAIATMISARSTGEVQEAVAALQSAATAMPEKDRAVAAPMVAFLETETEAASLPATAEQLDARAGKLREAAALPHGHPLRPAALARLGETLTQRGELPGGADAYAESREVLAEAFRGMPRGHPLRGATALALARAVLNTRWRIPSRAELDHLVECLPAAGALNPANPLAEDAELYAASGAARGMRAVYSSARDDFEDALRLLNRAVELIPAGHRHRGWLLLLAASVLTDRFSLDGDLQYLDTALDLYATIEEDSPDVVDGPAFRAARGTALMLRAMRDRGTDRLERGIADMERALSTVPADLPGRDAMEVIIAASRHLAAGTVDGAVLDRMIKVAGEASTELIHGKEVIMSLADGLHRLARGGVPDGAEAIVRRLDEFPGHFAQTYSHEVHAEQLRARGDLAGAVRAGLRAQRARLTEVMVQTAVGRGLDASREAGDYALNNAKLAIRAAMPAETVEALELGRGTALHAATASGLGRLLDAAGEGALAREWADRTTGGRRDAQPAIGIPDDLRRRVVLALARADEAGLVAPPGVGTIAAALRGGGFDALIHLLPRTAEGPGRAVLVRENGRVDSLELPGLDPGPRSRVDSYRLALMELLGCLRGNGTDLRRAKRRWRIALLDLCEWAWRAGMERVLEQVRRPGRVQRVVLVPWGRLGLVPWHAAGLPVEGRYACQQVAVTYAASARQLCAVLARTPADPAAAPLLVSDPTGQTRLPWCRTECDEIARLHYPAAERLGRWRGRSSLTATGEATAEAVLARLPGGAEPASLLHLGCHAVSAPSAEDSAILLHGEDGRLSVDRILERAAREEAGGTGPLIVLSACTGDLTENDHDEALTLASALLAAGAAGVVASRWAIDDDPRTALMMTMFHHFLGTAPGAPGEALRRTQAWMLDPEREIPDTISSGLRRLATEKNLGDPAIWAAFTAQGR